jgi:hypothetical protein
MPRTRSYGFTFVHRLERTRFPIWHLVVLRPLLTQRLVPEQTFPGDSHTISACRNVFRRRVRVIARNHNRHATSVMQNGVQLIGFEQLEPRHFCSEMVGVTEDCAQFRIV